MCVWRHLTRMLDTTLSSYMYLYIIIRYITIMIVNYSDAITCMCAKLTVFPYWLSLHLNIPNALLHPPNTSTFFLHTPSQIQL